jgi:parvulin-like peptidyl-prolyl isomerase
MVPKNATAQQSRDTRQRAEDALRQAKATTSYEQFGVLAEKISEDDYRVVMGDHRAVSISSLPPQVVSSLQKMKPGEVSGLIQVDQIYTIVRLNGHTAARLLSFAEVKDRLRDVLQRRKAEQLRSELNAKLHKKAKIEEL